MSDRSEDAKHVSKESPAEAARGLVRRGLKAALATLDRRSGHPYASLVTVATTPEGEPVFLISRLALHTQNLEHDARASLLLDGTSPAGDPLAGGRVTLVGTARRIDDQHARRRFLARHPGAEIYVDFPDFAFWRLVPETAHYVGGFGRIVDLKPKDLLLEPAQCRGLAEAEAEIIAHMNMDHEDALSLYATRLLDVGGSGWRMTGLDPEGIDLANETSSSRLAFGRPVSAPSEVRNELVRLAALARGAK